MSALISWIKKEDKIYFLTPKDINSSKGKIQLKDFTDSKKIGHTAIRKFYKLDGGIKYENKN